MSAASLRRLQDADDRVTALTSEIAALRAVLRGDAELESARRSMRDAEAASDEYASQLAAAEQSVSGLDQRARTLDRKLYGGSVHNPNELLELQRELDGIRAELAEAEERMLTSLESADESQKQRAGAQGTLATVERQRDEQEAPRRQRLGELEAALTEAEQDRRAIAESLDSSGLALYARVASRHHPTVVSIKDDMCGGCHLPLSNEERRAVRAGDSIVQCSSCDRILVP